jgi:uncharacterized protein (TIGR02246 family)
VKRICTLLLALVAGSLAAAQDTPPATPASSAVEASVEAQHEGLRTLQAIMEKALNSRDIETILANVDENVVFTTMNGDVARGKEGIRKYFHDMMEGPNKVVENVTSDFIPDDLSVFHGNDVAIAFGKSDDHYVLTDGKKFDIAARWSTTLIRKNDRWLVASFHYSANVFDNPILAMQRKILLTYAAGGALVLAIAGFFLGRRSGRRVQR